MYRSRYSKEVTQKDYDKQITVAGWLVSKSLFKRSDTKRL